MGTDTGSGGGAENVEVVAVRYCRIVPHWKIIIICRVRSFSVWYYVLLQNVISRKLQNVTYTY